MNITLQGKTALVIGGASPMNKALCLGLVNAGANVWHQVFDKKEIETGGLGTSIVTDVRQPAEMKKLAEYIIRKDKKNDILINSLPSCSDRFLSDVGVEEWLQLFEYHVDVPFLSCKEMIPHMVKEKGGVVVNVSSSAAITGEGGSHFAAAKSTLNSMTRGLAREYKEKNVRVAGVAPALFTKNEEENQQIISSTVATVMLLCSEYGEYISGESIMIDGGKSVG